MYERIDSAIVFQSVFDRTTRPLVGRQGLCICNRFAARYANGIDNFLGNGSVGAHARHATAGVTYDYCCAPFRKGGGKGSS